VLAAGLGQRSGLVTVWWVAVSPCRIGKMRDQFSIDEDQAGEQGPAVSILGAEAQGFQLAHQGTVTVAMGRVHLASQP
jgi:hypothetical protein